MKSTVKKKNRKSFLFLPAIAVAGAIAAVMSMQPVHAEPLVYVPLGAEGKILAIDGATDKIINTIGGVPVIHGLAETPDGQFLVAGSLKAREGGKMPQKPAKMSAKDHAAHHKSMPAGAKMAKKADMPVSTVSIISTKDGSIVRRIDVPGAVHHVAISPDGKFAIVTHPRRGTISAIDLGNYKVVATIATGAMPNYAVFNPVSGRAYVSNGGNNTVSEIDPATWKVRRSLSTGEGPGHMVLSGDSQNLYVANGDEGTVSEINLKSGVAARTFNIGDTLHGMDISNDAKTLFVSDLGEDKLVAIDLKTMKQRAVKIPAPYHLAALRQTGKLYVSSADEPDIKVIDQASLAVLGTISIGGRGHQMALSPGS